MVPLKVKGKMYKTMVRPAMLYGMETVGVTKKHQKQMEVAEMRMLRFSMGITRKDKIRNQEVREKLSVCQLERKLRETRLRWYGHVKRRNEEYVGQKVMELRVGKRKRGRPKRRWKDCIVEDMRAVEINKEEAADRALWRRKIHSGDPT